MLSQTYAPFGELSMLFLVLFTFYSLLDWVLACLWVSHNRIMDIACSLRPLPGLDRPLSEEVSFIWGPKTIHHVCLALEGICELLGTA
jgi:hypothetical protein